MEDLLKALEEAEVCMESFDSLLKETKQDMNLIKKPQSKKNKDKNIDVSLIKNKEPQYSFSKNPRFNNKKKVSAKETEGDVLVLNPNIQLTKPNMVSVIIPKAKPIEPKQDITISEHLKNNPANIFKSVEDKDFNPNIDFVKKRSPSALINSASPKKQSFKQKLMRSGTVGDIKNIEQYKEDMIILSDMGLDDSMSFDDQSTQIGPGAYSINYSFVESDKKAMRFSKSERFLSTRSSLEVESQLNPNFEMIRPNSRRGVTKIMREQELNEKLKFKRRKQELLNQIRNEYLLNKPIDNDIGIRPHIPGVNMQNPDVEVISQDKLILILHLLSKKHYTERRGPGYYSLDKKSKPKTLVAYRNSSTAARRPYRIKPLPGPGRYNVNINAIKALPPKFSFLKEPKVKTKKISDLDMRPPLVINYQHKLPRGQNAIILPEHKRDGPRLELYQVKIGPGYYKLNFEYVEQRVDNVNVKYQQVTKENDRIAKMRQQDKEVYDFDLNPDDKAIRPNKPVFIYHLPIEHNPQHPPQKLLFKEKWKFYDYDLNKVKEDILAYNFARKLTKKEFIMKEEEYNKFIKYLKRKQKMPEIGQYNVKYDKVEPGPIAPDFGKQKERDDEKRDIDSGNVLIIEPNKQIGHIPTVKFSNMVGRPEDDPSKNLYSDEVIIEPNYNQIQKKVVNLVNISKQGERPPLYNQKIKEDQGLLDLDVNRQLIDPKVPNIYFSKFNAREDEPQRKIIGQNVNIEPKYDAVQPKKGTAVDMQRGEKKSKDIVKPELNDGRITTSQRIDHDKIYYALKSEACIGKFSVISQKKNNKKESKKIQKLPKN